MQYNPEQTTLSFERYDVDGYSWDYSNPNLPAFNYGFDVTNPSNFVFSSSTALGDASLIRLRPNKAINTFETVDGRLEYDLSGLAHGERRRNVEAVLLHRIRLAPRQRRRCPPA